jgi:hypothetical protein|tara:strand:+ start:1 stop:792 length:792 start_codon:yes stop_codon:yes gene_type:complete
MKIGIQVLAYNCRDTFEGLIKPWIDLKENHNIKIWVGSGQFKLYNELGYKNENESTIELLQNMLDKGEIDYLFQPDPDNLLGDFEMRDKCIPWMRENDIDLMIQVDADEFYGDQAQTYLEFILNNQDPDCYNTIFKNIIGKDQTEDWKRFSAAWIKRNGGIGHYYFDCHWSWSGPNNPLHNPDHPNTLEYRWVNTIDIPKEICHPAHYTWTIDDNTTGPSHIKDKIKYQQILYGGKQYCEYEWDEENQQLIRKTGTGNVDIFV